MCDIPDESGQLMMTQRISISLDRFVPVDSVEAVIQTYQATRATVTHFAISDG